jgi:hypothetical protein
MISQAKFNRLKAEWSSKDRYWWYGWSFGPGGNGDLLYNTARKIIEEDIDDSDNDGILENIFACLQSGKRWPDYVQEDITTTNHKQTDLTKDPWIMAYCCAVYLDRWDLIKDNPPPRFSRKSMLNLLQNKWAKWSFFLPNEYAWYKELAGEKNRYSRFWRRFTPYFILPAHTYVLYGFMDKAWKKAKQRQALIKLTNLEP